MTREIVYLMTPLTASENMNARDRRTLHRLVMSNTSEHLLTEIANAHRIKAAEREERRDVVGQRWNERAAALYENEAKTFLANIDGRETLDPSTTAATVSIVTLGNETDPVALVVDHRFQSLALSYGDGSA